MCRLKGRKVKKNYPVGFSMLSSSMAMVYSEMFKMKIIALGIQKLQPFLKHTTEINHFLLREDIISNQVTF